jgi:hypothetical protein
MQPESQLCPSNPFAPITLPVGMRHYSVHFPPCGIFKDWKPIRKFYSRAPVRTFQYRLENAEVKKNWCRCSGSNRDGRKAHRILSPARLPIPPHRQSLEQYKENATIVKLILRRSDTNAKIWERKCIVEI